MASSGEHFTHSHGITSLDEAQHSELKEFPDFRRKRIEEALLDVAKFLDDYTVTHGLLRDEQEYILTVLANQIKKPTVHKFKLPIVRADLSEDRREAIGNHVQKVNERIRKLKKG